MLESFIWIFEWIWNLAAGMWLGIFTKSSIPIIIFALLMLLSMGSLLWLKIKAAGKNPRLNKMLKYAFTISFMFCIFSVGVASKGLPVDTTQQNVQLFPTGDYVVVGEISGIGGVNLVIVSLEKYYEAANDSTGNNSWSIARFAHFVPEQLHKVSTSPGTEITIANVEKTYRIFERLAPLPGDSDEEDEQEGSTYGMLPSGG